MLLGKYRTYVMQYTLVTWKCSQQPMSVVRRVSCDARKTCLTSEVLLSANVFIQCGKYPDIPL
jgi:hypothetical protein